MDTSKPTWYLGFDCILIDPLHINIYKTYADRVTFFKSRIDNVNLNLITSRFTVITFFFFNQYIWMYNTSVHGLNDIRRLQ